MYANGTFGMGKYIFQWSSSIERQIFLLNETASFREPILKITNNHSAHDRKVECAQVKYIEGKNILER